MKMFEHRDLTGLSFRTLMIAVLVQVIIAGSGPLAAGETALESSEEDAGDFFFLGETDSGWPTAGDGAILPTDALRGDPGPMSVRPPPVPLPGPTPGPPAEANPVCSVNGATPMGGKGQVGECSVGAPTQTQGWCSVGDPGPNSVPLHQNLWM